MDLSKIARKVKAHVASDDDVELEYVSTGNLAFDLCLDGGTPYGYVIEFLGLSKSGKSLFLQQLIANAQKEHDAVAVMVDRENSYFPKRGEELGINNDKLILAKPKDTPTVLSAFQFIIDSIKAIREDDKNVHIIVGIDSIPAFGKDTTLDKGDSGRKAKSVHEGLREVLISIDKKVMLIICNQVTYRIGVLYGNPATSTSGESMKYYSHVRISLEDRKRIIDEKKGGEITGSWIGVEIIKTRLGPAYRTIYLRHLYKTGIDYFSGYVRLLVQRGYLTPKNKEEFKRFKQQTVKYGDKELNEYDVEKIITEHPELKFEEYPEYNESSISS